MYYRVFDHQRGIYFATGYNDKSMPELVESFRSYIYGAREEVAEENLQTWEQIADYLQEVELEQSETPFEEMTDFEKASGFVRAYYNDTISGNDNGYQVNLMFFRNKDDDDYFDEEFITTNSPKEAEVLAEKINKYLYSGFLPQKK